MKFDKETIIILVTCLVLMLAWPSISSYMGWTASPETPAAEKQEKSATPAPQEKADAAKPAEAKPAEAKPAEAKPAEAKPAEAKPAEAKPAEAKPAATVSASGKELKAVDTDGKKAEKLSNPAEKPVTENKIENKDFIVTVGKNGAVTAISFKHEKYTRSDEKTPLEIAAKPDREAQTAIASYFIPDVEITVESVRREVNDSEVTTSRTLKIPQGRIRVAQTVTLKDGYIIKSKFTITNIGNEAVTVPEAIVSGGAMDAWHLLSGDEIRSMAYTMDYMTADGDFERVDGDDDEEDFFLKPTKVRWAGVANKYFSLLLKRDGNADYDLWQWRTFIDGNEKKPLIATGEKVPKMPLAPGESKNLEYEIYAGPKLTENLENFAAGAEQSLHLAWGPLNYLARFMMWILNLLYALCHNYGLSIILLTLLVRTAFYPITARGNESMKKMQKVQPKFKELREKYKDNPQLLNQKMTELYRQEGVNPFAGCLPILLQIPIFFALYAMLDNVIELRHVSFLWCKNLAAADTVCRIPFPFFENGLPLNPLVLVMTALMVVQQRMTPMSVDPVQKKMMMFMPVIMLLFLYNLPSGLTLYWTVSNIFSIVQLWLQQRRGRSQGEAAADK